MRLFIELAKQGNILFPGVKAVLQRLGSRYPMALATASERGRASIILDHYGLSGFFPVKIFIDDVKAPKPDPEAFLLAARGLGIGAGQEGECTVIEDSERGIVAAYRAGMKSIAIPTEYTADNDFSLASKVIGRVSDIDEGLIESLYM